MSYAILKDLLHRQDVLEKSHKQQLITEIRKKKALTVELQTAEQKIKEMDNVLKVNFLITLKYNVLII